MFTLSRNSAHTKMHVGDKITVQSLKFDGRIHRSWPAHIARLDGPLIILEGVFAQEVRHPILGTIAEGTLSTEYFWTDRWYGIFRFRAASGHLRNFYCNINTPARLEEGFLTFIDLDIDVLVKPDFSYQVLDVEEFEAHARQFGYPIQYRARTMETLRELISLIEKRAFPFSII